MKRPGIYILTNTINGKQYVGMDSNLPNRVGRHFTENARCPAIHSAILKYGKDAFHTEIIPYPHISHKALCAVEQWKIAQLDTEAPNGYNLTRGGEGSLGYKPTQQHRHRLSKAGTGKTLSQSTRDKISIANTGKVKSAEHREKLGKSHKGKTLSKEHREKLRIAQQKRWQDPKERQKMSIALTGKKQSAATRRKRSQSLSGYNNPRTRTRLKAEWMYILSVARVLYESEPIKKS